MRILIADDDPVSRRLLERTLARLGHEVVAVSSGLAARDALLSDDAPRLAILDWVMPELDGLAVCREVRSRRAPYVYVILLTSRGGHDDMVAALGAQIDDFLTKPFEIHELQARIQSGARILDLQNSLLDAQAQLQHVATHDRLTGLWNRGMIIDHLDRELARAGRTGDNVIVALADVDHFKNVNDTHGHDAGDAVLTQAALRMKAALRRTDAVGRYGGEEFLIVLSSADIGAAETALERVRASIAATPMEIDGGAITMTVSIGVAVATREVADSSSIITRADEALYRAKADGRNLVRSSLAEAPAA